MGNKPVDVIGLLQEQLDKYRAYAEYLNQDAEILSVSFQCHADNQRQEVAQVFAVIALSHAS